MAANGDNKAGGYKAALMKNQDQAAAAQGIPPAAIKTPNQANQGMPAIPLGGDFQVENLLSAMQLHKQAKEEEFRRAQEEEDKLTAFLIEVQSRFPGKKMVLVDRDADLVPRPPVPAMTQPEQPAQRQENGHHERVRWTPDANWDQVSYIINGHFAPFVCRRTDCPNRGQEFWGNIGQSRKKDCNGCNRRLVPLHPEDHVGYPLYSCPDEDCEYMWTYHADVNYRCKVNEAPLTDCPICGITDVAPCRVGNSRLLAAWLVKGALNEWHSLTNNGNYKETKASTNIAAAAVADPPSSEKAIN